MANYIPDSPRSVPQIRAELDKIAAVIETLLHRDGTAPNQMEADLDMDGNEILNAVLRLEDGRTLDEVLEEMLLLANAAAASAAAASGSAVSAEEDAERAEAAADRAKDLLDSFENAYYYDDFAEAQTDLANRAEGDFAIVTIDETKEGYTSQYRKEAGAWVFRRYLNLYGKMSSPITYQSKHVTVSETIPADVNAWSIGPEIIYDDGVEVIVSDDADYTVI